MHELSIVQRIVSIATNEAHKAEANTVESIELDIGTLSGIEIEAFRFAWRQVIKNSLLAKAEAIINTIEGEANCLVCNNNFAIEHYAEPCTSCGSHFIEITHGKELSIKAITVA